MVYGMTQVYLFFLSIFHPFQIAGFLFHKAITFQFSSSEVESYNPLIKQWSSRPSLKRRKGSVASVSLEDKMLAVGGGDGVECFSEVEIFDPNVGRWIPTQSMCNKVPF